MNWIDELLDGLMDVDYTPAQKYTFVLPGVLFKE